MLCLSMSPSPSILLSISLSSSAPLLLVWAEFLCLRVLLRLSVSHVSLCLLNLKPSWFPLASRPPRALVSVSTSLSPGLFSLPVCLSVSISPTSVFISMGLCPSFQSVCVLHFLTLSAFRFSLSVSHSEKVLSLCSFPAPSSHTPSSHGKNLQ